MIRMTAEIEIYPSNGGEIQTDSVSITPDPEGTNVSAEIGSVVSMHKSGSNPFIFGASKLNNGEVFSSEEDYYIGKQLSNSETGAFTTPYVLKFDAKYNNTDIKDSPPISFRLIFDTYYNAHPKNIHVHIGATIGGVTIPNIADEDVVNNSPYFVYTHPAFAVSVLGSVYHFTITMSDWSMRGYPLRIQGIYLGLSIYGDRRNLLSISAPIKDRSDNEQPSYGIISNAGTLSLVDGTREIKEYARLGLLTSDLDVQLWLEDTQSKKKQSLGKFKTDKWSYDNINFEVTIDFKDDLEQLQDIQIEKLPLSNDNRTLYDLYIWLTNLINETFTNKFNFIIDDKAQTTLEKINSFSIYLESDTAWNQLTKILDLTGGHIYENYKREVVLTCDFGD